MTEKEKASLLRFENKPKREVWNLERDDVIGNYLRDLKYTLEKFKELSWNIKYLFGLKDESITTSFIESEINLVEFYFEYKKKQKCENFNKWIEVGIDQIKQLKYSHYENKEGRRYFLKANGRIKALVILEKGEKSIKVSLEIANDSDFFHFNKNDSSNFDEVSYNHFRSMDNAERGIVELQNVADRDYFQKLIYPKYFKEKRDFDVAKKFLHIEVENEEERKEVKENEKIK